MNWEGIIRRSGARATPPAEVEGQERTLLLGALALGLFWAIGSTDFEHAQPWIVGLLLLGALCGWAVVRGARFAPWAALAQIVAVGYAERILRKPFVGSDVLAATREAIDVIARGGNPYDHLYVTNNPPGSSFPYLPGEIAFYAIPNALFGTLQGADKWAGIGIVFLLATLAPAVGPARAALATALYSTFSYAAYRSTDGSNDTSLAFLVVLATVLLAWSARAELTPQRRGQARVLFYASAVAFAWALLFKQFAWLLYPFIAMALRRRGAAWREHVVVSVGLTVLIVLPFALTAPIPFLRNVVGQVSAHPNVWGLNLWAGLQTWNSGLIRALIPVIPALGLIALAAVALVLLTRPVEDLGVALFQGLGLLFVALFLARWTTSTYYMFACAVLAAAVGLVDAIPVPGRSQIAITPISVATTPVEEPPPPLARPEAARQRAARARGAMRERP